MGPDRDRGVSQARRLRIGVDARPAVFPQKTGIGYYTRHLLRLLPKADPDATFVAWYLNARGFLGGPRKPLRDLAAANLVERATPIPARWFDRAAQRFDLPRMEWFARFDVLFAPNFVPPPTRARRLVVTVHDLAFKRYPETAPHGTRWWLARLDQTLARATRIIAVSESTRRDLLEQYRTDPHRVVAIPLGVDRSVFRPARPEEVAAVRARFGLDGPYLLYLGGIEPRKNLPNLLAAFAAVQPRDLRLVIAGAGVEWNPEGTDLLTRALQRLPTDVHGRVRRTGYVSEPDKVSLLSGAEAFLYPSLYEGFGLPVLEAMACGTPVVTSDVSSLPEVAGDAAVLVDPADPEAIAAGVGRVLSDGSLRERLRIAGLERAGRFTWEETARRTAAVLREAAGEE
jgi:glycosyltransferase involved in cell wall biosynthesis